MVVSIIIPTKDRPGLLRRCLAAVLDQRTDVEFEVVVVNDGGCSVAAAVGGDPRVTLIESSGVGPAAARNAAALVASGEILIFTDDDAIPQTGWIQAAADGFAKSPTAVGLVGRVHSPPFDLLYEHSVTSGSSVGNFLTCNVAYRRRAFEYVGGFDEGFPYPAAEDRDLGYRLQAVGPVLFEPTMVVVHPPRPVTIRETIRRAKYIESEWKLHQKHPQTRPPRWSVRWGPVIRMVRSWQGLLTQERVVERSARRTARFAVVASGQCLFALQIALRQWRHVGIAQRDQQANPEHAPFRVAWIGPAPIPGGGVAGCASLLVTGIARLGCEVDCYLAMAHEDIPQSLETEPGIRVVNFETGWRFDRWYSNHPVTKIVTGHLATAWARRRMATLLLEQHELNAYDVIYQFSTIELFGLRRHLHRLPPLVLHPETHMAGELRWIRRERALAAACEPLWRRIVTEALLVFRSRLQRRDIGLANGVVAISRRFSEHLAFDYNVGAQHVSLVPNPVDLTELPPPGDRRARGPWRVAFVSRMSVRKGVEVVVELSQRLADLEGSVMIDLVGAETLWSDYRPLLKGLNTGVARYLGYMDRSTVVAFIAAADVLIQPAKYEPFGLTVAEALACGVPVVATDEVGAAEEVSPDCCAVVAVGDIDAFETAVRTMITRLASGEGPTIRATARREAERLYAPQFVSTLLYEALSSEAVRIPARRKM